MEIGGALKGLHVHLTGQGFAVPAAARVRAEAARHSESTYPLALFAEWLERTPEARQYLASYGGGLGAQGGETAVPNPGVTAGPGPDEPGEVLVARVNGPEWKRVTVMRVVGRLFQVRAVDGKGFGVIPLEGFHEECRAEAERFRERWEAAYGAEGLSFDEDPVPAPAQPSGADGVYFG